MTASSSWILFLVKHGSCDVTNEGRNLGAQCTVAEGGSRAERMRSQVGAVVFVSVGVYIQVSQ